MINNRKKLLRGRIVTFIAVALSLLLLTGGLGAVADDGADLVKITVEHIYDGREPGLIRTYNVDAGVYAIDEFYEILGTRASDVVWDFMPEDNGGGSTIELRVGSVYAFKVYYSRLYTVTVVLNGGNGDPSGGGRYGAGVDVVINAGTRDGFTFSGWTVTIGGVPAPAGPSASFTMPANDVTITANWTPNESGERPTPPEPSPSPSPSPSPESSPSPSPEPSPEPSPGPTDERTDDDDEDEEVLVTGDEPGQMGTATFEPGGTNHDVPPVPNIPGNTLVPVVGDDGSISFMEFDDEGIPLGEWSWSDELEMWVFDELVPLGSISGMPQTGESSVMLYLLLLLVFSMSIATLLLFMADRRQTK